MAKARTAKWLLNCCNMAQKLRRIALVRRGKTPVVTFVHRVRRLSGITAKTLRQAVRRHEPLLAAVDAAGMRWFCLVLYAAGRYVRAIAVQLCLPAAARGAAAVVVTPCVARSRYCFQPGCCVTAYVAHICYFPATQLAFLAYFACNS